MERRLAALISTELATASIYAGTRPHRDDEMTNLYRAGRVVTVTPRGTIRDGAIAIKGGRFVAVGTWEEVIAQFPEAAATADATADPAAITTMVTDAGPDAVICPGLIDCHAHNLEFGPGTAFGASEEMQLLGATELVVRALRGGVTALGEQVLGHFQFKMGVEGYRRFAATLPITVAFSAGCCSVGTEPVTHVCSAKSGGPVAKEVLFREETLEYMAASTDYPGEHAMATITPANLPAHLTPNAGRIFLRALDLRRFVDAYHRAGRRSGMHIEGDETARYFVKVGGDVIHHGHGLSFAVLQLMAACGVELVATPAGGTGHRPNSPGEILAAVGAGVRVSIATDAVMPLHRDANWFDCNGKAEARPSFLPGQKVFSEDLAAVARPALRLLSSQGLDENEALALITRNPAQVLGRPGLTGTIEPGAQADLVIADGIPGVEVASTTAIRAVVAGGKTLVSRQEAEGFARSIVNLGRSLGADQGCRSG